MRQSSAMKRRIRADAMVTDRNTSARFAVLHCSAVAGRYAGQETLRERALLLLRRTAQAKACRGSGVFATAQTAMLFALSYARRSRPVLPNR